MVGSWFDDDYPRLGSCNRFLSSEFYLLEISPDHIGNDSPFRTYTFAEVVARGEGFLHGNIWDDVFCIDGLDFLLGDPTMLDLEDLCIPPSQGVLFGPPLKGSKRPTKRNVTHMDPSDRFYQRVFDPFKIGYGVAGPRKGVFSITGRTYDYLLCGDEVGCEVLESEVSVRCRGFPRKVRPFTFVQDDFTQVPY